MHAHTQYFCAYKTIFRILPKICQQRHCTNQAGMEAISQNPRDSSLQQGNMGNIGNIGNTGRGGGRYEAREVLSAWRISGALSESRTLSSPVASRATCCDPGPLLKSTRSMHAQARTKNHRSWLAGLVVLSSGCSRVAGGR